MMFLQTDRPLGKMRVPLSDPPWTKKRPLSLILAICHMKTHSLALEEIKSENLLIFFGDSELCFQ
jgi:hypothetical protein